MSQFAVLGLAAMFAQPTDQPMIVLGSSPEWLVWGQFGQPIERSRNAVPNTPLQPWSLRILSLAQVAQSPIPIEPTVLLNGSFDQSRVPGWGHRSEEHTSELQSHSF